MLFAHKVLFALLAADCQPDRALAQRLDCCVQQVNQECRYLEAQGKLRRLKSDGPILNCLGAPELVKCSFPLIGQLIRAML
jgi:hypothetical protein